MPKPNVCAAEEVLIEAGVVRTRNMNRQAILGCVACRLRGAQERGEEPKFHGYQIVRCTEIIGAPVVYRCLKSLRDEGALRIVPEDPDNPTKSEGPERVNYGPSGTELGRRFFESLEAPRSCDLPCAPSDS